MIKLRRFFFEFFLIVMWPSVLVLGAVESPQSAVSSKKDTSSASSGLTTGIDGKLQMDQGEVRDPFEIAPETEAAVVAAPSTTAASRPEIKVELQGIGFGSKDGYAIIGGDIYYMEDEKKGIKLLEVRRREVDVLVNGGKMTVPLFQGDELKKAKERAKKHQAVKDAPEDPSAQMPASLSEREQPTL